MRVWRAKRNKNHVLSNILKSAYEVCIRRLIAKNFSNTFRYINDLLTLNNPTFEKEIKNIYPPQLELKKITETDSRLSDLDLEVNIVDGKFTTAVFDKRDGFSFHQELMSAA